MGYSSDHWIQTIPPTEGLWMYREQTVLPDKPDRDEFEDDEEYEDALVWWQEETDMYCTDPDGCLKVLGWKWYECHNDLIAASLEYPDVVIQLDREGENNSDIERCWYSNGRCVQWRPTIEPPQYDDEMFLRLGTEKVMMKPGFTYYPRKETTE